jgi:eukaryotic-like serine/threonine-protein kinase
LSFAGELLFCVVVTVENNDERKTMRMVTCAGCEVKNFIAGDLPPLTTVACNRCGHAIMVPMLLRQFELRAVIGSGGMGTVYRAFDTTLQREVAVKLMSAELAHQPSAVSAFTSEARAAAGLNHTNIIHVYSFDEWEGRWYLVMELADQGSLDNWIEKEKQVPELAVLDVGVKIASALELALKHNLLHRDIKPGNILFNSEGEPKLVDFGLARKTEAESEDDTSVWGTPYYIAPEKIKRAREDFLSDMYSLAGTLYHALTGHVPFEAPTIDEVVAAHVHTPLTPPNLVVPSITQPTSDAVAQAMAKLPEERFESYADFIMALTAARSQLLVSHYRHQRVSSPEKPSNGKSWWRL